MDAAPAEAETELSSGTAQEIEGALFQCDLLDSSHHAVGYFFSLNEGRHKALRARSARVRQLFDGLLIDQLEKLVPTWPKQRCVLFPLDEGSLGDSRLPRLAPLQAILRIDFETADQAPQPATLETIPSLKRAGLRIALTPEPGSPCFEALAEFADAFVLDFSSIELDTISEMALELATRFPHTPRIAQNVSNIDECEFALKLGCTLASCGFARMRGNWEGNKIAPNHLHIASLLGRINGDCELREIADALKHDAALSYRLLRYINSAANGMPTQIGSIEQALVILGRRPLFRWLSLLFFAGNREAEHDPLMETALVRGRMMETLGKRLAVAQREDLFVTGVFSLLDLVLKVPLAEALEPLHLSEPVRAAILEGRGPYAPALAAAVACEEGDLARLRAACKQLGTVPNLVCGVHMDALAWAHMLTA
ncbi:MAG: HDOD domain-containing protein [Betaproteobacteria bacterium]|nr:HDOD domain-containing protein [Betaproteobacteria bacterium]